ncbi:MAG: histone deacetylase [Crocinitomicaceae bacterium]
MKVAFSPVYSYNRLPEGHRFPMDKYDLLPQQLLLEGTLIESDFFAPNYLSEEEILRTHSLEYWTKLKTGTLTTKEIRAMGFPYHESLISRGRYISKGTLECAYHALIEGIAMNIAGGTHHAYADRGEGFCIFNDFGIAANELLHHKTVKQILIIDLDVHQGNGTAKLFENRPEVFTFSMHGANNYPLKKEVSDLDVGVEDKIEDTDYLAQLSKHLEPLIDKVQPDIIMYLSGVDVLATDKLGRLGLTLNGCKQRDKLVFEACQSRKIPIIVSMGGGYSTRIKDIIEAHANTFRVAKEIFE